MPSSVTTLGLYAFHSCFNLKSVNISTGLTKIADCTFYACGLTSITIPSNIKTLEIGAFAACSSVTSLTLNEGLTTIGEKAFRGCSKLTKLTIPAKVESMEFKHLMDAVDLQK